MLQGHFVAAPRAVSSHSSDPHGTIAELVADGFDALSPLIARRIASGYAVRSLALAAGWTPGRVYQLECGAWRVAPATLSRYRSALDRLDSLAGRREAGAVHGTL